MNRKQLTILIVLVLLIGGIGLVLFNRQSNSWKPSDPKLGQKLFPKLAVNDVAQIHVKQSGAELTLVKKDDLWQVQERGFYPANFSQISELLLKAKDLKIGQSEPIGASQFTKLELIDPSKGTNSGTLVEFKDQSGKAMQSALLGKKHMKKSARPSEFGDEGFPDGRYVLLGDDAKNVFLISDALNEVEAKPENWLKKDFFKIEKVRVISLVSTNATNSWKLTRESETGGWTLIDVKPAEQFDTNKVSGVANSLSSPSFVDVVIDAKPAAENSTVATLETFDGFAYILKISKASEENYHLNMTVNATLPKERTPGKDEKQEDKTKLDKEFAEKAKQLEDKLKQEKPLEKWTYLVAKWTIDPLLRDRAQLMVEKKETPEKPNRILDPVEGK